MQKEKKKVTACNCLMSQIISIYEGIEFHHFM